MQFVIAATPPDTIKTRIIKFQRSFPSNRLPDLVEPHITIKAQPGLTAEQEWLGNVEIATKFTRSFSIRLNEVGTFDGKVVFLKPTDVPNLTNFHTRLVEAVGVSVDLTDNYFEGPRYWPHLTLGGVQWGMSEAELLLMKKRAETELADLPHFEISRVTLYQQNARHEPWQATRRILLGR